MYEIRIILFFLSTVFMFYALCVGGIMPIVASMSGRSWRYGNLWRNVTILFMGCVCSYSGYCIGVWAFPQPLQISYAAGWKESVGGRELWMYCTSKTMVNISPFRVWINGIQRIYADECTLAYKADVLRFKTYIISNVRDHIISILGDDYSETYGGTACVVRDSSEMVYDYDKFLDCGGCLPGYIKESIVEVYDGMQSGQKCTYRRRLLKGDDKQKWEGVNVVAWVSAGRDYFSFQVPEYVYGNSKYTYGGCVSSVFIFALVLARITVKYPGMKTRQVQ